MSQRGKLLAVLLGALVVVGLALVLTLGGSGSGGGSISSADAKKVNDLFAGIPQSGRVLGDPEAPETIVEFVDLQCPACAQFSRAALPELVRGPVRRGEVKLELRLLTFLGVQSSTAAVAAEAAAQQNKAWQFVDLFYFNQGPEESGYVTDQFIDDIYSAIGVDQKEANAARTQSSTSERVALDAALASKVGVSATPSFVLIGRSGRSKVLSLSSLEYDALAQALEDARK